MNDFPIARDNFARRLGLTPQGAGKLIRRFMRNGIIERTEDYIPHIKPATYKWLVGTSSTVDPHSKAELESPLPEPETTCLPGDNPVSENPLSKVKVGDLRCDLPDKTDLASNASDLLTTFGDQIIALLVVNGRLTPAQLREKIIGYSEHSEACDQILRRLQLQLAIDVDAEGRYRIGPEKEHFKLLKAQALLKRLTWSGLSDTDGQFESLSSLFGIDIDDLKRARDALLELGELARRGSKLFRVGGGFDD